MLKIIKSYLLPLGFILLLILGFSTNLLQFNPQPNSPQEAKINNIPARHCQPTFADGGGPYYLPNSPFRSKIVPEINKGERLIVTGKVMRKDCQTPISGAIVDIWQANESGDYEDSWYRGQIITDQDGKYTFETVVPKGYGEGTGYRPPHIHFKVFIDNAEIITSQMFFPEARGKAGFDDAYIMQVSSSTESGKPTHQGYHDIVLPI